MRVLVINCGSSTLKFQLIDIAAGNTGSASENRLAHRVIEHIGGQASIDCVADRTAYQATMTIANHGEATRRIFVWLTGADFLAPGSLDAVGHRVVHGGYRFTEPTCLDDNVIAAIDALRDLAPLHNEPTLRAIRAAKAVLGTGVPMVAGFETAFHHTLPAYATQYPIPHNLANRYHIRRYGFHGIAHRYIE